MALLLNDERATKAVLSFRKTRIGQMVTIPPRGGGEGEGEDEPRDREEVEGEEGGPGPPT